jgi:hypothetical protein
VNQESANRKRREEQTEKDISGVRTVLRNVDALDHRKALFTVSAPSSLE